ncbi:PAS domain-containing protein [Ferrovibrio sp.]|uniref:PAS domain-containing protein n=1 Tax=Ferrovibrio sp. TaxID=1917215 RepID=UPI00311E0AB7
MTKYAARPTGREIFFGEDEIIVSKTDLKGRITYANDVFCRVAGYAEHELRAAPHSIVRHPDMPRCVFWLLWETISKGSEIFAYVKNMAKNGDFYWVFAHVTPSYDESGQIAGYHSSRRRPDPAAVDKAAALYAQLLAVENSHADRRQGLQAGIDAMLARLSAADLTYEAFVFSL